MNFINSNISTSPILTKVNTVHVNKCKFVINNHINYIYQLSGVMPSYDVDTPLTVTFKDSKFSNFCLPKFRDLYKKYSYSFDKTIVCFLFVSLDDDSSLSLGMFRNNVGHFGLALFDLTDIFLLNSVDCTKFSLSENIYGIPVLKYTNFRASNNTSDLIDLYFYFLSSFKNEKIYSRIDLTNFDEVTNVPSPITYFQDGYFIGDNNHYSSNPSTSVVIGNWCTDMFLYNLFLLSSLYDSIQDYTLFQVDLIGMNSLDSSRFCLCSESYKLTVTYGSTNYFEMCCLAISKSDGVDVVNLTFSKKSTKPTWICSTNNYISVGNCAPKRSLSKKDILNKISVMKDDDLISLSQLYS